MVRNDDIFCSLLLDHVNRTIRVIDFRKGNHQHKHDYLESVLVAVGMRKIFTLIELADVRGWKRVGYIREGTVPGYYRRSDAYIMSRIYDEDWEGAPTEDHSSERNAFLGDVTAKGEELFELKGAGIMSEQVEEAEALCAIEEELARMTKKSERTERGKGNPRRLRSARASATPLFGQFNRGIEHFYWIARNRRTKQLNVYKVEYQDCFGNAKISMYFTPKTRGGQTVARRGLNDLIDWLSGIGAVAIFALVRADDPEQNTIYASVGFRNSGWMNRQLLTDRDPVDQVLWTKKLTSFAQYGQTATRAVDFPKCAYPGCKKNRYARGEGFCGDHFKQFPPMFNPER